MSTSRLQNRAGQNTEKELNSMKESIGDIINQLQDIDPARLSFSPFLDLDTQICMAPVSDSPESSVEELHSSSQSVSQHSLGPPLGLDQQKRSTSCHVEPQNNPPEESHTNRPGEEPYQTVTRPITTADNLESVTENSLLTQVSQGDIPNGMEVPRWSPETTHLDANVDDDSLLIDRPLESMELSVWGAEAGGVPQVVVGEVSGGGCCCRCKCWQSSSVPPFLSVLASLLCAAGITYGLYFYVPVQPPDFPDLSGRMTFTLCCCLVASLPILLAMMMGPVCQFCTASFSLQASPSKRQMFVKASLELLFLYVLNLLVMTSMLPREEMKLVPILVVMFIIGRVIYLLSLYDCSSWRGFGSGLTVFPLLAMVALNAYLMYTLLPGDSLFGYRNAPPSRFGNTSHSPSSEPDIRPTDTQ
ncbi:uncharacterized protein ACB057_000241 [Neosynchiropus ocellatus]